MSEFEPGFDESIPENVTESQPDAAAALEVVKGEVAEQTTIFQPSPEMVAILNRVDHGEKLTAELYSTFQIAGEGLAEAITDSDAGSLARLELQLACASLLAAGDELDAALETVEELFMTPEMDQDPSFGTRVTDLRTTLITLISVHRDIRDF